MNTYRVELRKPAWYYLDIEVEAETPEAAERPALNIEDDAQGVLEWDYSDPGGEVDVSDVVDCEQEETRLTQSCAVQQERLAKKVRVRHEV